MLAKLTFVRKVILIFAVCTPIIFIIAIQIYKGHKKTADYLGFKIVGNKKFIKQIERALTALQNHDTETLRFVKQYIERIEYGHDWYPPKGDTHPTVTIDWGRAIAGDAYLSGLLTFSACISKTYIQSKSEDERVEEQMKCRKIHEDIEKKVSDAQRRRTTHDWVVEDTELFQTSK
ncbi:hypothetical protein HY522_10930 [bacterium]|nr:hypothetical protein [bacterium]